VTAIPLRRIEGKYEILEKIREGGMGAIYKVRHRLLDEIRVIKLMRQQLVEDEELKTRFLREARLAIKLRHPNIAQLYDFTVDDDGTAFIVMEFIDGMTLEDLLAFHGPPPLGLALEIAQQSLKALGYLHLKGFIHRDISPDNLMLTEDTEGQPLIKLIDLGIAKTLEIGGEHLTQTGTFLGKIRYASPEQFGADGATTVDARGDLYSFGIVLYELLTARFPIQGKDPSSMIGGHLFRPPLDFAESDPGGRVPAGLRAAVLKTLAKAADDRFATAGELVRALSAFRAPDDLPEGTLKTFLARPFDRAGAPSVVEAGSTQDRLNQKFDLARTPSPGTFLQLARTAPPPAGPPLTEAEPEAGPDVEAESELEAARREEEERERAAAFAAALAGIREALEKRSYRAAESLLYAAEASFGPREEFAAFHDQVAEERQEDLEAKAAAAAAKRWDERRAAALAAALAEIDEALDRGDPDAAGALLDRAVVRFGAADPLRDRWQRLEAMRAAAKVEAVRRRAAEEKEIEGLFEATQEIADLVSRREGRQALQSLHQATARYGDRPELVELRKKIAALLIDG
jgi:eukaryotic-like serine/threonine-protein kinase